MTAIFMDGFDHYGTSAAARNNMLDGAYSAIGSCWPVTPGWGARTGQYAMGPTNNSPYLYWTLPSSETNFFMSYGFSVSQLANGFNSITQFLNGSGTVLFTLQYTPTGALQLINGSAGSVLGITSGPVVVPQNWHFFEMEIDTAATTFTLRVDDATASNTPILTVNNAAITGSVAQMNLLCSDQMYLDDLFIRDASGSTNNGWLGDRQVATLLSDQDTAMMGWTPNYYHMLGAGILNNTAAGNTGVWTAPGTPQLLGTGDFTIESFVRFQSLPTGTNKAVLFGKWDETHNELPAVPWFSSPK
jgi:hypothetical protein